MQSKAKTVEEYLESLPEDRRAAIEALRKMLRENVPKGVEEGMQYGMIGYYVPHSRYPAGYHCDPSQPLPFASLAAQKNHIAVYLLALYLMPEAVARLERDWKATGKKLDMGKSCVRFKRLEDAALEPLEAAVRALTVEEFIAQYEAIRDRGAGGAGRARAASKAAARRTADEAQGSAASKPRATKKGGSETTAKKPTSKKPTSKSTSKPSTSKMGTRGKAGSASGRTVPSAPARTPARKSTAKKGPGKRASGK
jgi:hypothetical protein